MHFPNIMNVQTLIKINSFEFFRTTNQRWVNNILHLPIGSFFEKERPQHIGPNKAIIQNPSHWFHLSHALFINKTTIVDDWLHYKL